MENLELETLKIKYLSLQAENEKLKEANKKLRELLERLRKEPSLMKIPKWGAQDMYAGLPPAMRLIDVALSEASEIEGGE